MSLVLMMMTGWIDRRKKKSNARAKTFSTQKCPKVCADYAGLESKMFKILSNKQTRRKKGIKIIVINL